MASVLYIEDEPFFGNILAQKMHENGIDAFIATSGQIGLEMIGQRHFDLILLDIMLPGMSGFDVLEKVKNDPATKDIPVIILSNLDTHQDRERAKLLGASTFLVKMLVTPSSIVSVILPLLASVQKPAEGPQQQKAS